MSKNLLKKPHVSAVLVPYSPTSAGQLRHVCKTDRERSRKQTEIQYPDSCLHFHVSPFVPVHSVVLQTLTLSLFPATPVKTI